MPPTTPKMYLTPTSARASTRYSATLQSAAGPADVPSPMILDSGTIFTVASPMAWFLVIGERASFTGRVGCADDPAAFALMLHPGYARMSRFHCAAGHKSTLWRPYPADTRRPRAARHSRAAAEAPAGSWSLPKHGGAAGAARRVMPVVRGLPGTWAITSPSTAPQGSRYPRFDARACRAAPGRPPDSSRRGAHGSCFPRCSLGQRSTAQGARRSPLEAVPESRAQWAGQTGAVIPAGAAGRRAGSRPDCYATA